jgi:hypothetical protein
VFFEAVQRLQFAHWQLADRDAGFLQALLRADLDRLPEMVDRAAFETLRNQGGDIALLVEPRVTFAGKGYAAGFSGSSGTHVGYSYKSYRPMCQAARELLKRPGVDVVSASWNTLSWDQLSVDDFAYFDPPYFGTKASYPNIDHDALMTLLNGARFRWALSGYADPAYEAKLRFMQRFERERNAEIKSSNAGGASPVIEVLWTNY